MKRPAEAEAQDPPSTKKQEVEELSATNGTAEPEAAPGSLEANPSTTEAEPSEPPAPKPFPTFQFSLPSSFTTDPAASPFQFPSPLSNGFTQLAQEAAKKSAEDEDDQEGGNFTPLNVEIPAAAANAPPKFDPVEVQTGEEDEITLFTIRAKLLQLVQREHEGPPLFEWKERGKGMLKINQNKETLKCRLLLRTDGLHALALNTNVDASCSLVQPDEHANSLRFSCFSADGKPTSYCVRFLEASREAACTYCGLYDKLKLAQNDEEAPRLRELFGVDEAL